MGGPQGAAPLAGRAGAGMGPDSRMHAVTTVLLALLAGGAQALSLAWPGNGQPLWWLQIGSMVVLASLVLRAPGVARAASLTFLYTLAWLCGTFWWLFISMHTYGGLPAPLAVAALLVLAAALSSYYAGFIALFKRFSPKAPTQRVLTAIFFAGFWLLAELARGQWWTGFPWGAGGYAHVDGPLAPLARYVGVYGLGAVATAIAMWLALLRRHDWRKPQIWASVVLMVLLLWGAAAQRNAALAVETPGAAPALSMALLQGNIQQDEKFLEDRGIVDALQWYGEQMTHSKASLVVTPETAIPIFPQQLPKGYLNALGQHFSQPGGQQATLVGIPLGDVRGYTNSVLGFSPEQLETYQYDKHHLVPFGESTPGFLMWFSNLMDIPLGGFNRGAVGQASFRWLGQRVAPNICYEDLFGEELGARFSSPELAPTIFVNMSNIAWFGDSIAIDQHLQISRMRSLEFERPMVRSTNTGATAVIDHAGRVVQQLPRLTRGVLLAQVQGRGLTPDGGWQITPFARWVSVLGLWPLWALGILIGLLAWGLHRQRGGK